MRHFSRSYRCITYSARGYLPSDLPTDPASYSQDHWRDDVRAVIDGLGLDRPHVVGLSQGAFAALHFGMRYCSRGEPPRARSLTLAGVGSGAHPAHYSNFQGSSLANADLIRSEGMDAFVETYGHGPSRIQHQRKDPRGFAEYAKQLAEHDAEGSAMTMAGYQGKRPSLYSLVDTIARIDVPVLILTGDEDELCIETSVMLKRAIARPGSRCCRSRDTASTSRSPRCSTSWSVTSSTASSSAAGVSEIRAPHQRRHGGLAANRDPRGRSLPRPDVVVGLVDAVAAERADADPVVCRKSIGRPLVATDVGATRRSRPRR
jgi:pimeloyl-ACP methyl ester carboxylesterase